jgi:hypothetical protein
MCHSPRRQRNVPVVLDTCCSGVENGVVIGPAITCLHAMCSVFISQIGKPVPLSGIYFTLRNEVNFSGCHKHVPMVMDVCCSGVENGVVIGSSLSKSQAKTINTSERFEYHSSKLTKFEVQCIHGRGCYVFFGRHSDSS